MTWIEYVNGVAKGDTQAVIGHKLGLSGATISRWATFAPKPENVAAFARAYNRPVLEAFVAAGFLTAEEAGQSPVGRPKLSELSSEELLSEIGKRVITYPPEPGVAHDLDVTKLKKLPRK